MGKRLVRDRALNNWMVPGAEHQVRPVRDAEEHRQLLREKLLEECGETIFAQTREELIKEMSDVLAVLEALVHVAGLEWDQVLAAQEYRELSSGGFVEGLVWETGR